MKVDGAKGDQWQQWRLYGDKDDPLKTMMIHWSYNGGSVDNHANGDSGFTGNNGVNGKNNSIGTNDFIVTSGVIGTNGTIE